MYPKIVEFGPFEFFGRSIGPIGIYSYGLMLALGFLTTNILLRREYERRGIDPDLANNIILGAIVGGLFGAKAYSAIENWRGFLEDPLGSFLSGSGLVWYGGLFMGAMVVLVLIWRSRTPMLYAIDPIGPMLAIGYAFGRMGCLLSGDGDYGPPTDLPWGISFPNGTVPPDALGFDRYERMHPTPIYEIILMSIAFAILWRGRKKYESQPGFLFGLYLILAGVERLITEFWRLTPEVALGLTMAQWMSFGLMIIGAVLIWNSRRRASPA